MVASLCDARSQRNGRFRYRLAEVLPAVAVSALSLLELANGKPAGDYETLEAALADSPVVNPSQVETEDGELIISSAAKAFFDKAINAQTLQFRNVALRRRSFAEGGTYTVLCGETNGANRFGGMTGYKPFMVGKFQGRRYDPVVAGEMTELSSNIHNFCYNADPVIKGDWLSELRAAFSAQVERAAQDR